MRSKNGYILGLFFYCFPLFLTGQVLSYPIIQVIDKDSSIDYRLFECHTNEITELPLKNNKLSKESNPLKIQGDDLYFKLQILKGEKIMNVYLSVLPFEETLTSGILPYFLNYKFQNLLFKEGCYHLNLIPYATKELYEYSNKLILLNEDQNTLNIEGIDVLNHDVSCEILPDSFAFKNIRKPPFWLILGYNRNDTIVNRENWQIHSFYLINDVFDNSKNDLFKIKPFFAIGHFQNAYIHFSDIEKNKIIAMTITKRNADDKMNIYIKPPIGIGSSIFIKNFQFITGSVLYDFDCAKNQIVNNRSNPVYIDLSDFEFWQNQLDDARKLTHKCKN